MSTVVTEADRGATLEGDLDELFSTLGETFRGLRHANPLPQELRDAAARGELGPRHMRALLGVAAAGHLSVSELARRLGLELSTTSAIAGQLSRAGLISRAEDESDHRRTILALHGDYAELIITWADLAMVPLRGALTRLSPDARANFMEGWRILHEEATRAAPPGTADAECT